MARYVDSILTNGEHVITRGRTSMLSMLPAFIGGGFLVLVGLSGSLLMLITGGFWIGVAYARRATTELAVTNKRLIAKSGLFDRNDVALDLTTVESVRVEQSILGKVLDYGSIVVSGRRTTHTEVPFIARPMAFRQAVITATDAVRMR